MKPIKTETYNHLLTSISDNYTSGKIIAFNVVNTVLEETNWKIGQHIVEFEQGGNTKAEYGDKLLERLSKDLSLKHGKGFSLSNINRFRQFYLTYPILAMPSQESQNNDNQSIKISAMPSHLLSWSHFYS
jgi:hypothetical protein